MKADVRKGVRPAGVKAVCRSRPGAGSGLLARTRLSATATCANGGRRALACAAPMPRPTMRSETCVLITGATGQLAEAVIEHFARRGANMALLARDGDALAARARQV